MIGTMQIADKTINPIPPNTPFINCDDDNNILKESDTNPPTTGIKFPKANLAVFIVKLSILVTYRPWIDTKPKYIANIAPRHAKFVCFMNDDSFFNFIFFDKLFITNIANAIVIDTNKNFLKNRFINVTPPINIGFSTVEVIGNPTKTNKVINIGIMTFMSPIVVSIVALHIDNTSLNPIKVNDTIVINTI